MTAFQRHVAAHGHEHHPACAVHDDPPGGCCCPMVLEPSTQVGHSCGYGGVLNPDGACPRCEVAPEVDAEWEALVLEAALKGLGRNDPCPCGSGRKVKKCHGA